ncbi:hypothetical protein PPERSA_06725 [Pseudocohnilembus persalinus]|uniref:Uncharacterized protein n=1 Tax=Pseudocohnilembus persalinus TaxID=266149 RepID=A0A0V0QS17_PSEPJ|nr:hypothetical protein PPERSA_06725 [Pseudocohnilembus persalinus]|eukprot:KRX05091.1 hypothetical protein PPERSA_06725 [Pseudocohnilembus persalinus]
MLILNNNRLTKLENICHLIPSLRKIDVSDNYIDEMMDLSGNQLEDLNISGNNLKILGDVTSCQRLRKIDFSKNYITNINIFHKQKLTQLKELYGSNNQIGQSESDNVQLVIRNMPRLEILDLGGNDITKEQFYKYSILTEKKLQKLDGITLTQHNYEAIMKAGKATTFDKAIKQTNEDYINRLNHENQLRKEIKKALMEQMEQVDQMFDKFHDMTLEEQSKFVNFIKGVEIKKRRGVDLDIDDKQLEDWKQRVQQNLIEEKQKFEAERQKAIDKKNDYINQKITGENLRGKLYEIAMNDPNLWRELKSKELKQLVKEQGLYQQESKESVQMRRNYNDRHGIPNLTVNQSMRQTTQNYNNNISNYSDYQNNQGQFKNYTNNNNNSYQSFNMFNDNQIRDNMGKKMQEKIQMMDQISEIQDKMSDKSFNYKTQNNFENQSQYNSQNNNIRSDYRNKNY